MPTKIYVNLPVKDLARSTEFFNKLGFSFDERFSNDQAGCLIISDDIYAMLLVEPFFQGFAKKEIADTSKVVEVLIALSVDSRDEVDDLADKALAAGAGYTEEPEDHGFMYARSFTDLDGHGWQILFMEPSHIQQ